jgi:DNA integrity scanning protein DisA with diadenylate cyclase activity
VQRAVALFDRTIRADFGLLRYSPGAMGKAPTTIHLETIRAAVALADRPQFHHLLYVGDLELPEAAFRGKPRARKKLAQAIASPVQREVIEATGIPVLALPEYDLGRAEKMKLAVVSGIARGLYAEGDVVVGLLARAPAAMPDSILVVTVGQDEQDGSFAFLQAQGVSAGVMDALLDLAIQIGIEGWEGRPTGALFVIGDASRVMEKSRQLSMNPFQGYSEDERNILNPDVRHALHAFAVLDGACVMREDGVVVAAGRYLNFDEEKEVEVPLGLGARHMAAAGISRDTEAIALVISQTSGAVRVFKRGKVVIELPPRARRS